MEHESDLVADGKAIEEESYLRRNNKYTQLKLSFDWNNITLTGKVDFFDTKDKVIHETKRSNKVDDAHIWQVKFYLWLLGLNGIGAEKGIIEYPKLRLTETVMLEEKDIGYLEETVSEITKLVESSVCPPVLNSKICKSCSYYDFCYSGELTDTD